MSEPFAALYGTSLSNRRWPSIVETMAYVALFILTPLSGAGLVLDDPAAMVCNTETATTPPLECHR